MESTQTKLKILEFYSGIGGMHYGAMESGVEFEVLNSFDINTNANLNYKYTFEEDPSQKSIEALTVEEIEKFDANAWLMSPVCQPFTRLGLQKDDSDNRTNSFFHLLDVLTKLKEPPTFILIENVFGFAKKGSSNTRDHLLDTLISLNYTFQEFHLSPQYFGLSNQRTRYFCIAKRNCGTFNFQNIDNKETEPKTNTKEKSTTAADKKEGTTAADSNKEEITETDNNKEGKTTTTTVTTNNKEVEVVGKHDNVKILDYLPGYTKLEECDTIENYLDKDMTDDEIYEKYKVPHNVLLSKGMLFDIKVKSSKTTNCFTKNYGRFIEGSGSILQMDENYTADPTNTQSLIPMKLRYFTPKEITRLHGFPETFKFSPKLTTIQCWRLIGNSLNVRIVSELIKLLISSNNSSENENDDDVKL